MKTTIKTIAFLLAILAAINSHAQHIIRYERGGKNAERSRVLFVDTLRNEVIDSFYLHERNPYWNLPYDTIETGNYMVKTYKFNNIDTLRKDEIPGLIAYGPGNISRYPYEATASQGAFFSTNGHFIVTTNSLILYVYSENDFVDHASKVVTYNADGKIHHSFYSEDLRIDYVYITDNGNYYHIYGWMHDINAPHGMQEMWKIIDKVNDREVFIEKSSDENLDGLYSLVYNNYILLMQSIKESSTLGPKGYGYLRCFDMENGFIFSTLVDPNITSYSMFKRITSEGVHMKSLLGKDEPDQVLRFDKDFTKQPIQ